jgi:hypothetical protein
VIVEVQPSGPGIDVESYGKLCKVGEKFVGQQFDCIFNEFLGRVESICLLNHQSYVKDVLLRFMDKNPMKRF